MKRFAIVGGGPTTVYFLDALRSEIKQALTSPLFIDIYDGRAGFGKGLGFRDEPDYILLNSRTKSIIPFRHFTYSFAEWLTKDDPSQSLDLNGNAPRAKFGTYLREVLDKTIESLRLLNVVVDLRPTDVVEAEVWNSKLVIKDSIASSCEVDKLFLFCGNFPRRGSAISSEQFIGQPYPTKKIKERIGTGKRVAILGAHLTAIDAALSVVSECSPANITLFSRSGHLPAVRSQVDVGRRKARKVDRQFIERYTSSNSDISIADVVRLIKIEAAEWPELQGVEIPLPSKEKLRAGVDHFRAEISKAKSYRLWQNLLSTSNEWIELLWSKMSQNAQQEYYENFHSWYLAKRASLPLVTANRLLPEIDSGVVDFRHSICGFKALAAGGFEVRDKQDGYDTVRHFDWMIDGRGSPRDIAEMDSPLLDNLRCRGFIKSHTGGGIEVDIETCRVISRDNRPSPNVYAVGHICCGALFYINTFETVVRHARKCALQVHSYLGGQIVKSPGESRC